MCDLEIGDAEERHGTRLAQRHEKRRGKCHAMTYTHSIMKKTSRKVTDCGTPASLVADDGRPVDNSSLDQDSKAFCHKSELYESGRRRRVGKRSKSIIK